MSDSFLSYKKYAIVVLPIIVGVGVFIYQSTNNKTRQEEDYHIARSAFTKWNMEKGHNKAIYDQLELLMQKHPELKANYDTFIVQKFLSQNNTEMAMMLGQQVLERLSDESNYYNQFAETTLVINQGNFRKGLDEAKNLHEKMLADSSVWSKKSYGSTLFAFNLLRLATLYQELGEVQNELKMWNDLKRYAGIDKKSPADPNVEINRKGFELLLSHFTSQEISLLDYIKYRLQEIQ